MQFSKIPAIEKELRETRFAGRYQLENFSFQVPDENLLLEGLTCRPSSGYTSYYYNEVHPKEKIVLHFTAGYLKSDIQALSQKNWHVSVAFVIARDGTIYQLHNSDVWSYHLGRGAVGGNAVGSKKSIGIELCNYGYLVKKGNQLETIYSRVFNKVTGRNNPVDVYCSLDDTEMYTVLDEPYRGQRYYATHTEAQYESLIVLLRYLTAKHDIPRDFLSENERYQTTAKAAHFKGILSHVNFRKSGKWDLGPAFDWERVMLGVQADAYQQQSKAALHLAKAKKTVSQAEAELQAAQTKLERA
ncbi:MAG: N-acetylmuramoyl-L-alanine amidase, partial [Bacteroidota bacterium]